MVVHNFKMLKMITYLLCIFTTLKKVIDQCARGERILIYHGLQNERF